MCVVSTEGTGGLVGTAGGLDISNIMQYLDHDKSSSISQLIKSKSRGLQKLLKYFNRTTTSASNILLSFGVLSIIFVLYSKKFTCCCFVVIYSIIICIIIFISRIIYLISIIIPQTSRRLRIIVTIL